MKTVGVRVVCAVVALVVGVCVAVPQAVSASPRSIDFVRIAAASVTPPSSGITSVVVDSITHRAYVIDYQRNVVTAYDAAGAGLTPIGTIAIPAKQTFAQAIDETHHRLYVLDGFSKNVVVVDVDPASPSVNTVIGTWATRGAGGTAIAVDPSASTVYVANEGSDNVSVIDGLTGAEKLVPTGRQPTDVAVDRVTHRAYVSSTVDSTITTVFATGSSITPVENRPLKLAFGGDALVVSSDRPYSLHLESYDPRSMTRTASSFPLASQPTGFTVDEARHLVFIADATGGVPGIRTFRSDTLAAEGSGEVDGFNSIAVDQGTHRVFVAETPRLGPDGSHVVMFGVNPSPLPSVDRVGGADRFVVSAGVSAGLFSSGVPVVYVASGTGFADALSGSAAAGAQHGPVLLVTRDAVPDPVVGELSRLRPQRIVVLGGPAAVSDAVLARLGGFSPVVSRIGGADRFEVSAAVSRTVFPGGADTVYVASGENYPDALSGSAAAGHDHGPVLLVTRDAVPAVIGVELSRLKPKSIVLLGGVNAVTESVAATLAAVAPVMRVDGPDRFAVSAAISQRTSPVRAYTVYIASGENFPDALSGAAVAIADGAPVLLVTHDTIPAPVVAQLQRLQPYRIVVLGGPAAVSDTVLTQLQDYLPD